LGFPHSKAYGKGLTNLLAALDLLLPDFEL